ncbi:MAG: family 16 glycosylhydrolase [Gammaproteobacteria bacterium]
MFKLTAPLQFAGSFALALIASFATLGAQASCALDPDCPLVWADEFDGDELDQSKWSYMIGNGQLYGLPGWGNNELQYYTDVNDTVANGVLTITAKNDGFAGYNYTSTRIRSLNKGDFTYGRFEMRAKLPTSQGMWPAFWMLPTDSSIYGTWAASGEIDVMEATGDEPDRILGTIHYGGTFPANTFSGESTNLPTGSANAEFHTYAVEWQEGQIRWYIDDVLYAVQTAWYSESGPFPAPFDVDFHMLLNLAVGGFLPGNPDSTTVFPMDYVIDYVRVYELPPEVPASPSVQFDDFEHGDPFANDWFSFNGQSGGGGIVATDSDLPPAVGGSFGLQVGYGSGGASGFAGGFGRNFALDLTGMIEFSFWINPLANQSYRLEVNFQDDDNGDNVADNPPNGNDDEFQFNCDIGPTGPCAIAGGGWQEVVIPLNQLFDDNSFHFGGNGSFDPYSGTNGPLTGIVMTLISTGTNITFVTDQWEFSSVEVEADEDEDGVPDSTDNCTAVANADQTDSNGDGFGNACDADLNNDNIVNFLDLSLFSNVFLTPNADADFNSDGNVNFFDLVILQNAFFAPPGPAAGQ